MRATVNDLQRRVSKIEADLLYIKEKIGLKACSAPALTSQRYPEVHHDREKGKENVFLTNFFLSHFILMVTYVAISGYTRRNFVELLFLCCNHIFLHM